MILSVTYLTLLFAINIILKPHEISERVGSSGQLKKDRSFKPAFRSKHYGCESGKSQEEQGT